MTEAPLDTTPTEGSTFLPAFVGEIYNSYYFRIIVQGLITIWAVTTFTFVLVRQMPGNPVEVKIEQLMIQRNINYDQALQQAGSLFDFNPDAPLWRQYLDYMAKLARGDLGQSIEAGGAPVSQQIIRFLPWTLFSVGSGLLIAFTIGIIIGTMMAYWRGSLFDNVMTAIASITYGIPDFVIALLIVLVLGVQFKLFNVGAMRGAVGGDVDAGFNLPFFLSVLKHGFLPIITYVLATVGGWVLTMKSSTISTLGEDYITAANARGLSQRRIVTSYVGRNALLPLVTRLAISFGLVIGGSVIIEQIFVYPGLGSLLFRAVSGRDYTTMQGVFLVIAFAVVASNIVADVLYGLLDPRVRVGDKS